MKRMKTRIVAGGVALAVLVAGAADGYKPTPPPLARSLTEAQIDDAVSGVRHDSIVGVPAWYAKQAAAYRPVATNALVSAAIPGLGAVIADSRANIPELEGLSDIEVAELYLAQMAKPADELKRLAPTNSLEYLIGAGMRADILARKGAE